MSIIIKIEKETVVYMCIHVHTYIHNGMVFIHKKILQCMTAWTNLEVIMLREVNQTQKKLHDLIYMRFKKQNKKNSNTQK